MATTYEVPVTLFNSVFKNITSGSVYVPFLNEGWGGWVKPSETFSVKGDPRSGGFWTFSQNGTAESIELLVRGGKLQFVSSPAVIVDDEVVNDVSATIQVTGTTVTTTTVPVDSATANSRDVSAVSITFADSNVTYADGEFNLSWTVTTEPFDTFEVSVEDPDKSVTNIKTGKDKNFTYPAEAGSGSYGFTIKLIAIDGQSVLSSKVVKSAA